MPKIRKNAAPCSSINASTNAVRQGRCRSSRVRNYLIQVARQSGIADAASCDDISRHFHEMPKIRVALRNELGLLQLSELQFQILVVLYSADPTPIAKPDLACGVNRTVAGIRAALTALEAAKWLTVTAGSDRAFSQFVALAEDGRRRVAFIIYRYLRAIVRLYADEMAQNRAF